MPDLKIFRRAVGAMLLTGSLVACATATPVDDMRKAVVFDDVNAVQKLLARGMDPNQVDAKGDPMLVVAVREKSAKVIKTLSAAKAIDFDKANAAGETPLMMACLLNEPDVVKLLVEQYEVEINKTGWTPLHYAATNGNTGIVKYLLDHSAYIDAESPNATTPLMMAARGGHIETVKLLLDEGADMRLRNQQGMTVIDFAERYHQDEIAAGLKSRWQKLYPDLPMAAPAKAGAGK
ncbi:MULTISPECIES: ankyrin repeat domain-containing protein [Cupriavidus]|nr:MULTISPECIES: ankyrin repeat domain-containing protein [Cupriavidus]